MSSQNGKWWPFSWIALALAVINGVGELPAQDTDRPKLTEYFELPPIRMRYTKEGKDAADLTDADKNDIPDQVEDTAKQAWAAHNLYCETLKFPDPLEAKRYEGVKWIEYAIWHKDRIEGLNGLAFDEPQRSARMTDPSGTKAITAAVGNHLNPIENASASHEMFHLIQYGATYFKPRWFLEGMARWSERGLGKGGIGEVKYDPRGPWPQSLNDRDALFRKTYDSDFVLWYPIARQDDKRGLLPAGKISKELKSLKYSNGQPVLRDNELVGADIMRDVLLELDKLDDIAFKELGYESWSEDNQRSEKNSPYVYQGVMDVLRHHKHKVGKFSAKP